MSSATSFVVSFVVIVFFLLFAGAMLGYWAMRQRVLRWLIANEADARAKGTPPLVVELPGYQATIRRYRIDFKV